MALLETPTKGFGRSYFSGLIVVNIKLNARKFSGKSLFPNIKLLSMYVLTGPDQLVFAFYRNIIQRRDREEAYPHLNLLNHNNSDC